MKKIERKDFEGGRKLTPMEMNQLNFRAAHSALDSRPTAAKAANADTVRTDTAASSKVRKPASAARQQQVFSTVEVKI